MLSGLISLSLGACVTPPALVDPLLQPCRIEGRHDSLARLLGDGTSTTFDVLAFAGHAEDAVKRCNADKAAVLRLLNGDPP